MKLAQHITAELRAGDIAGRMGGDEFTLALVRADAHSAERVLQRLRTALAIEGDWLPSIMQNA